MFNIGDMDVFSFARNCVKKAPKRPLFCCPIIPGIQKPHRTGRLLGHQLHIQLARKRRPHFGHCQTSGRYYDAEEDILHSEYSASCWWKTRCGIIHVLPAIYKLVLKQSAEFLKENHSMTSSKKP
jgi:hypothetical protein